MERLAQGKSNILFVNPDIRNYENGLLTGDHVICIKASVEVAMAVKTFAAIDVGSFELAMKIYEISSKNGMREIEHIRHRLALGADTYSTRKISPRKMDELCRVLREFDQIMKAYHVTDYKAYGTSAIRETENTTIVLDQIKNRTGLEIEVLSNSEQRFLDYKSVASRGEQFKKIIERGTAIADIGGGNIQISLFDNDTLVITQNLKLGVLRLHERMLSMRPRPGQVDELLEEMIQSQLAVFKKLYMKDRQISNLIVVDDYVSRVIKTKVPGVDRDGLMSAENYQAFIDSLVSMRVEEKADCLGIPEENVDLFSISAHLIKNMVELMEPDSIWAPGVTLGDGIAYEYAEKNKRKFISHDFEKDILACAGNISKRYMGSRKRSETMEEICLTIFDSMQKVHGMGKRERLLLQLSAILHDCGKFINMTNVGECSYNIIMNTEMIGLSHVERQIVAFVVRFNHDRFLYYDEMVTESMIDRKAYLVIAKLAAILRLANSLDKSHKQKFKKIKGTLSEQELVLTVEAGQDILLEQEMLKRAADFFEEVYCVRPRIEQKKQL